MVPEKETHLEQTKQAEEAKRTAKLYFNPNDRTRDVTSLKPSGKGNAFQLVICSIVDSHPSPNQHQLYYGFGFILCSNPDVEGRLGSFYICILRHDRRGGFERFREDKLPTNPTVLSSRFWEALESYPVIEFFRQQGSYQDFRDLNTPHLEGFIRSSVHPSVWSPGLFCLTAGLEAPLRVPVDYGFMNCAALDEKRLLKDRYRERLKKVDPMDIHRACVGGRLYECGKKHTLLACRMTPGG